MSIFRRFHPQDAGSVSGAPNLPEGFRDTFTSRYIDAGEVRMHAYAESDGYLTLLSDGERLTGAHALGPDAGEWLGQATLATRARVPRHVLLDTIQPFPTFSEIYLAALKELHSEIAQVAGVAS